MEEGFSKIPKQCARNEAVFLLLIVGVYLCFTNYDRRYELPIHNYIAVCLILNSGKSNTKNQSQNTPIYMHTRIHYNI